MPVLYHFVVRPPKNIMSPSCVFLSSAISLIILTFPALLQSQNNNNVTSLSDYEICSPFNCGNITFSFPFSSASTFGSGTKDCGLPGYQITCDASSSLPGMVLSGRLHQVVNLFLSERLITVVDTNLIRDLSAGSCSSLSNLTIPAIYRDKLSVPTWAVNLTLLECPNDTALPPPLLDMISGNSSCNEGTTLHHFTENSSEYHSVRFSPLLIPNGCNLFLVPMSSRFFNGSSRTAVVNVLNNGFPLTWPAIQECNTCSDPKNERCGFDLSLGKPVCFYKQAAIPYISKKRGLIIGVATGSCSFMLCLILLLVFRKRIMLIIKGKNEGSGDRTNAERFIKTYQSTMVTNYSYNEIKKMTDGFRDKLGEGGYGNVYKGKLPDGRLVAVKLLEKMHNIGQQFVSEVETIGRIHHINVITLLGFSWNGSKQALIYEYMPNGSLGDLLSDKELSLSLGMPRLLEIAIGIAHGIEYLHNGCGSRILHLDIKPQNVLLDQNFNPKISDFGLAKIYSRSRSGVTMTDARGTIGYIAPEVFLRNLGNVSHKSDVYSYGMLLLDMVGGTKHIEQDKTSSSEAYFPGWIYDKLVEEENMELGDIVVEEDASIARKIVVVGLWCIQMSPKDRPSMTRVVEMLTGNIDAIELPPKPFFSSPPPMQSQISTLSPGSLASQHHSLYSLDGEHEDLD